MYQEDKQYVKTDSSLVIFGIRLKRGFDNIVNKLNILIEFVVLFLAESIFTLVMIKSTTVGNSFVDKVVVIMWVLVLPLLNIATVIILGNPLLTSFKQSNAFKRVGLTNRASEAPTLLSITHNSDNTTSYEYYANGITLKEFIDSKESIESTLNVVVIDIRRGRDRNSIILKTISGENQLPDRVDWNDDLLPRDDADILLGISEYGPKLINLDRTPHIQCGGITGCGKSVLLRCVLHQLDLHHARVILVDFKGLLDFSYAERSRYECLTTKEDLADILHQLVAEMEHRKKLFASAECSNISQYNRRHPYDPVQRIMLASDEIAFAFQKKGLTTPEEKALVSKIEADMAVLAQQGRFAGIHLWLSTQRGDADTIPPQIRSNLTVRICGRASDILSRVTIDSSIASEIPKSLPGRFVDDSEEFFQAYYYTDERSKAYGLY